MVCSWSDSILFTYVQVALFAWRWPCYVNRNIFCYSWRLKWGKQQQQKLLLRHHTDVIIHWVFCSHNESITYIVSCWKNTYVESGLKRHLRAYLLLTVNSALGCSWVGFSFLPPVRVQMKHLPYKRMLELLYYIYLQIYS